MLTSLKRIAVAYYRLSKEEALRGESSSIENQRLIIRSFCQREGYTLVREYVDDGFTGGNFERPGFQEMLEDLSKEIAGLVITKDLSRLGRDMRESSYYAEQYFPEHGIRYLAIADSFDTERENVMAPFLFAMNEVYLRDGSRKVRDVLRNKRENGQYCACPPYGYRKSSQNKHQLAPDENTAPVVYRIFERAAQGDSSRKIAMDLNADGIIPPLKYRVLYRDEFSDEGAARASDLWSYTTVKRILKNQVYLGHSVLGKSKKASVKSKKKVAIPKESWVITYNTHTPIVSQQVFDRAQQNLGKGSLDYRSYDHVRKSIFSGIAMCAKCGHALCSAGTVYKGEREKYWYLACIHQRQDITNPCTGVRIRYADLMELVRKDLSSLLSMTDEQIDALVQKAIQRAGSDSSQSTIQVQRERAQARLSTIDKIITKLYTDNAMGNLDDDRLRRLVVDLEKESTGLHKTLSELESKETVADVKSRYDKFFALAREITDLTKLDRHTLQTFIERIEVGPKEYPEGTIKATHRNMPYRQRVRIFYRFIGEICDEPTRQLPVTISNFNEEEHVSKQSNPA